jgi:type IV pilus assembly protein PilC
MNDDDRKPLDYRSPFTAPLERDVFSFPAFLAGAIIAVAIAFIMLLVVPRFEQIFKDFGTKLPALTQVVLQLARITASGGWVALTLLPVIAGFLGALIPPEEPLPEVTEGGRRRRRRMTVVMRATVLILFVIAGVTILALFLPMISLINAVSGSGKQ